MSLLAPDRGKPVLLHVYEDGKRVVGSGLPRGQQIAPRQGLHVGALVQHEAVECPLRDEDLEVGAGYLGLSEPAEVEVESSELAGVADIVHKLLQQFAPRRLEW